MFRKQSIMKDISSCFSLNQNTVVMSDRNGIIWLNDKEVFQGEKYLFATIQKDDFFVFGNSKTIYSGKISEQNFKLTDDKGISWGTYSKKGVVVCRNRILDEEVTAFKGDAYYLNFKTGEEQLLFEQEFGGIILTFGDDTKAIYRRLTTFKSLSLETGEYLWETNISIEGDTDPRIKQVLGISGDVLVVFTFGSTLVGIDLHTGKILWHILPKGFYPSGFTGMAWCWHLEDGYLYLLRHQYYLRINLSNQQLEVLWQTPADTLEFEDCSYTEDHVYFMAIDKKSNIFNTSVLGVFDRKALKIVWQHDQPIYSSQPPQSDGDKLYCLDNGGVLHIFEKEENE